MNRNKSENSSVKRFTRSLARARRGNAAVEFSLLSPILVALLMGVVDVGVIAYERTDMFAAMRSGAQYFMAGGTQFDRAAELVRRSWTEAPADATVTVDRFCQCATVESACNQPCPDGTAPDAYARITAKASVDGILKEYGTYATDVIRIR